MVGRDKQMDPKLREAFENINRWTSCSEIETMMRPHGKKMIHIILKLASKTANDDD